MQCPYCQGKCHREGTSRRGLPRYRCYACRRTNTNGKANDGSSWNHKEIDEGVLAAEYSRDRSAVSRLSKEWGCSIQTLYGRLHSMGMTVRRGGDATVGLQARENNPNWKGGKRIAQGYIRLNLPSGDIPEHRVVAERMLGRPLLASEVVHHKDGNTANNHPSNLQIFPSHSEHMRCHMTSDEARRRAVTGNKKRALRAVGVIV